VNESPKQIYEFGEFRLHLAKRLLLRADGASVPLTPRVFDTLLQLVQHSGTLLEKEKLMDAIWPDQIVEENNLSQNISTLRRALGETAGAPRYIMTVPGRGYRFLAEVRLYDDQAESVLPSEEIVGPQAKALEEKTSDSPIATPSGRRLPAALAVAVLALGVGLLLFWRTGAVQSGGATSRTIAVLPFKPLIPERSDPILEMGMADTLIAKLATIHEIIVRPLGSVRKYDSLEQDPLVAGRALGVELVLDGDIQRSGDHVRVTTTLIKVADGSSLWAGTFDQKFTDVFAVQDAISQKVAEALALQLTGEEKQRLVNHGTSNIEAYQLYLTGRYHWNKLTPPEVRTSLRFFHQAITLDPEYAQAYGGLAEAYRALAITGDVSPQETMPQAKAAALKAIALDPSLAEAHASLVFIHTWFDWDWAEAEREGKRAIELNPHSGIARIAYAQSLSDQGRHEEAIAEAARARELDPVSLIINTIEGSILFFAGHQDAAADRLQKTLELDPNFWIARLFLGKVYVERKEYPEAREEFEKARNFSHGNSETLAMIGYLAALAGDTPKAMSVLAELQTLTAQRYIPPHNVAVVYLGLGERDEALAWLEKAYQDHDVRLSFLKVDPKWERLRSDTRFGSLLKRLGLE
jgi:serine/threonine-protein kinase